MYSFKAKHGGKVQNILLYKDMDMRVFEESLEALQYTSDFPQGNILGFKDMQGKSLLPYFNINFSYNLGQFIPPYLICKKPELFTEEAYDIIIKPESDLNIVEKNHYPSSTTNQRSETD